VQFAALALESGLWETVGMAEKRPKADKAQRQADRLEKKARQHIRRGRKRNHVKISAMSLLGFGLPSDESAKSSLEPQKL